MTVVCSVNLENRRKNIKSSKVNNAGIATSINHGLPDQQKKIPRRYCTAERQTTRPSQLEHITFCLIPSSKRSPSPLGLHKSSAWTQSAQARLQTHRPHSRQPPAQSTEPEAQIQPLSLDNLARNASVHVRKHSRLW